MRLTGATKPLFLLGVALLITSAGCGKSQTSSEPVTAHPWFEEVGSNLGIDFQHRSGATGELLFPEIMSGGVALFDADRDGDLDLFLVHGIYGPDDPPGELWRNDGTRFVRVEDYLPSAPRNRTTDPTISAIRYGMGVAVGDVDRDGDLDLFVTSTGQDTLLRNEIPSAPDDRTTGLIRFIDITESAGVGGGDAWSSSAGFFDADGDHDLDLFVTRYVRWTRDSDLDCTTPSGAADYCSPLSYAAPLPDRLYRNDGIDSGRPVLREISREAGLRTAFGNGLGLTFLDLDGDDDLDVFVANDQTPDQLWRNLGDGRFRDVAPEMGCAVGITGEARAGMGVATADLDDDGDFEVFVVHLERQADALWRNEGAFFRDMTGISGLGSASRRFTRFGVGFVDFDHDGHQDLYVANGRVTLPASSGVPIAEDPFAEPNLLLAGAPDGRFHLAEPAGGTEIPLVATSRAAAFGDLDGDGGVDIVVVNRDGRAHVLRNLSADRGHWLLLELVNWPGRTHLGAQATVHWRGRTFRRRSAPTSSYQSSHDPRLHFGLGVGSPGAPDRATVEVRWPDGTVENIGSLAIDRLHVVRREGHSSTADRP